MNKSFCIVAALCMLMLSGCASDRGLIRPIMLSTQVPAMDSGYLAGKFSRKWDANKSSYGLGILNTLTAEEYVIPFGRETALPSDVSDEFDMIQVPPGEYRVAYWITYSISEQTQTSRTDFPTDALTSKPFTLAPGEVVFLGSYIPETGSAADGTRTQTIRHWRLSQRSVQKALERGYPEFKAQPLSCPSCIE